MTNGLVHVVMAVFDPSADHLLAQMRSLAAQTGVALRLHVVVADLQSGPAVLDAARQAGLTPRMLLPPRRLGAAAAFEHGLAAALADSRRGDLFAFCDQDDVWHRDKLAVSVAALRRRRHCRLVHTDARLVDNDLSVLAPSMFRHERRDRRTGLRSLLYRNSITGMTAVFTRDVVEHALPFPRQNGAFYYHDLWIGLVAAAKGPVVCLPRPTVDYRQHDRNAVGAVTGRNGPRLLSRAWLRHRFASFSLSCYLAKSLVLRADELAFLDKSAFDRRRIRQLRPYLRHFAPGLAFFADAALYGLRGRSGLADHAFSQGLVKTGRLIWAARKVLRLDFTNRLKEFDDAGFSIAPGTVPRSEMPSTAPQSRCKLWYSYVDHRKNLSFEPRVTAERRAACTVLVPTLNPTEIFAGVATALQLGLGLAQRGYPVRFISTDLPMVNAAASMGLLGDMLPASERDKTLARIELACGVSTDSLDFAPDEKLVATAWWTAHLAQKILARPGMAPANFYYLVQDYEPNFYAWGTDFAGAVESYGMNCIPVFNTTILRDYFLSQGHGFGGRTGLAFRPSIDIDRYAGLTRLPAQTRRRIAVYGRPEVPRNMFPVCIEALAELVRGLDLTSEEVEIVSVGLTHDPILLPKNLSIQSLGKLSIEDYPAFLATVDIGLSLMYSPHPSHLPIEMAAAGARVVTNSFGPKDLSTLTPLITSVAPNPADVARALVRTWQALGRAPLARDRRIDLSPLGRPLDDIVGSLHAAFAQDSRKKHVA